MVREESRKLNGALKWAGDLKLESVVGEEGDRCGLVESRAKIRLLDYISLF